MENELERDTLGGGTVGIVGTDCGRDGVVVVYETNWPVPLEQSALLALKPPFLLLQDTRSSLVKDNIHQEFPYLWHEQWQVADSRSLHEVTLKTAV
jgi:hypothetical protein